MINWVKVLIWARSYNFFPSSMVAWSSYQIMQLSLKFPIKIITSNYNDLTFSSERSGSFKNNVASVRVCPGGRIQTPVNKVLLCVVILSQRSSMLSLDKSRRGTAFRNMHTLVSVLWCSFCFQRIPFLEHIYIIRDIECYSSTSTVRNLTIFTEYGIKVKFTTVIWS